jgi:uncharacterized RDD family membrane protein YckC
MISPDGRFYWDGAGWKSLVSADGRSRWDGSAWVPLEAAAPPPPPPAAVPGIVLAPGPISPWIAANYPEIKQTASYQGTLYAGFWIRLLAYIVDSLIVAIPIVIVAYVVLLGSGQSLNELATSPSDPRIGAIRLVAILVSAAYFGFFWSLGSTPGMRLFGLRVVDSNSRRTIGLGRALLRYVGFLISGVCCYIGLIWAAFDGQKQGWHDKIASTVVLYRGRGTDV